MKKKKLIIAASVAIGIVGLYLLLKPKKVVGRPKSTPTPSPSNEEFKKYRVATLTTSLNVREQPTTMSKAVTSVPKNSIILARESSTSGWYEYSKDGINVIGYVSKLYLSSDLNGGGSTTSLSNSYDKYMVTTALTSLRIRENPSTASKELGSLPKGAIIFAKPSNTSGWHIYSKDGSTQFGYVSSDFITLQ
jgi:uncharacterized protein YgiM (DUF1202 family)